jgi:hypothetical protein
MAHSRWAHVLLPSRTGSCCNSQMYAELQTRLLREILDASEFFSIVTVVSKLTSVFAHSWCQLTSNKKQTSEEYKFQGYKPL